ncbi:LuxR family transcriptional regulator [Leucobacter weissii]|uniref:LuxR family transcriptional regulator n=1 Tax=Leucobacter weissii TaxID=1983706 RepID=A0A939MMD8_9MICO|nr:LuxR C-terminal-related transcriptional regulator [Leucobacter weissii]MBO1902535.1 LuxR family transcriptional regulator [Leucobacter weissii]
MAVRTVERASDGPSRFRPPRRQQAHLERPRLLELIDERLSADPVLLVAAPSGYGKTSAVAEWAGERLGRAAWLTLGPFDTDPARIGIGVLQALQELARSDGGEDLRGLLELEPGELEPETAFDLVAEALLEAESPVHLVVDDAHRAQDRLNEGLLGALIDVGCDPLRLILVGTNYVEISLSRLILSRPHQVIRANDLAFDLEEIARLTAGASPRPAPEAILAETKGWPIAIRFMQLAGISPDAKRSPDEMLMRDYVRDYLLSAVPRELADVALLTSVCEEMTVGMAAAVSGRDDAAELLERCVRLGLFIDRYDSPKGAVYRWHGVFARHCRSILDLTDPGRRERAFAAAAAFAEADGLPLSAASYWLRAGELEAAMRTVLSRWVGMVVGPDSAALDRWCAELPAPHDDDPRILLVRACAHDVVGARELALMLLGRAEARAEALGRDEAYEEVRAQAALFLLDDRAELTAATARLRARLESGDEMSQHTRAAILYLLGFAELRHRRSPRLAVQLLSSAAVEAEAGGDVILAGRAQSNLSFALAWSGQLRRSRDVLDRRSEASDDEAWVAYAGGAAATAAGFIAYWRDDLELAAAELTRAIRGGSSDASFAGIARMMLAFTAGASRDAQTCHRAARELQAMPREERQGVSWPAFRHASLASLHEAAGHRDRALKIVAHYQDADDLPLVSVILAGIATRAGRTRLAARLLSRLERYRAISYVQVSSLATEALAHAQDGQQQRAHDLAEQAVELATDEDLRRPFSGGGLEMRKLLTEHLAWGTRYEEFITLCLSPRHASGPLDALSERERTVFAQLRTTKTTQEIAEALGVSINTVKTHQRAIYRKLGVATRRDAVRLFA